MKWLRYWSLSLRRNSLSGEQVSELAMLDREDERVGDRLARWEIPGVLALGGLLLLLIGLVRIATS